MIKIENIQDVQALASVKKIGPEFAYHLVRFFDDLAKELDEFSPGSSVEDHGFVVLLEPGNPVIDLAKVGINLDADGVLGCNPESIEKITLDGNEYYRLLELYNDSYRVLFFSKVGIHDSEVEAWLYSAWRQRAND